jgi:PadR family transcriptional regulator, regulatory protein PadR
VSRRLSPQSASVLVALAEDSAQWRYGYELGQQVDLRAGSLYPILIRLTDRGLLDSSWESDPPTGRPPRHLYRLTAAGRQVAAELAVPVSPRGAARPARAASRRDPRSA